MMDDFIDVVKKCSIVVSGWIKSFCSFLSKGFFFYVSIIFELLGRIFKTRFFVEANEKAKSLQNNAAASFVFVLIFIVCLSATCINLSLTSSLNSIGNNGTNVYLEYRDLSNINIDFKKLRDDNREFVGWINISGTNCNYPIVQTKDNGFYSNHDYLGNEANNGWIYMDYRNKFNFSDKITVIYGDKLMFQMDKLFSDQWLKNSSKVITIKDGSSTYSYKVFAVQNTKEDIRLISDIYRGKVAYKKFLNSIVENSAQELEVKVNAKDSIIVLVSDMGNDYKSYVFAKKIK